MTVCLESQRLSELAGAVRESTIKRLRLVPSGHEDWRPVDSAMSFADIAHHLVDCDRWMFRKMEVPSLEPICGRAGEMTITDRNQFAALIDELDRLGRRRASWLTELSEQDLSRLSPDNRFDGDVTVWWMIVRGNLDHEIHHRGQIDTYLRILNVASP